MISTLIVGSARRRSISLIHCGPVVPGNTRQSIVASATEGMTLAFGGSPTPERRLVREMVDCWIALLNLFTVNGPPIRCFIVATTGNGAAAIGSANRRDSARIR